MPATYCRWTNKVIHAAERKAEAALRSLLVEKPDYNGHVYYCVKCHGWHVGRVKKKWFQGM